jgi:hypothetical protein
MEYWVYASEEQAEEHLRNIAPLDSSEHLEAAAEADRREGESFQRCDTDGCVSQFCHGLTAQKERLKASIARQGNYYIFRCLLDLDGNLVSTKLWTFPGYAGGSVRKWGVVQNDGTMQWVTDYKRESNFLKLGLKRGWILGPAYVSANDPLCRLPEARGFSGLTSVRYFPLLARSDAGIEI